MINCVWAEGSLEADNRSRYATNTLLNNALDKSEVGFVHRNGFAELSGGASGAVVVIHGEHQKDQVTELADRVARLDWALTIVMGDEPRVFPSQRFTGPRRKVWRQYPIPGRHDHEDRRLIAGYPSDCPAHLFHLKGEMRRKPLDFSFMGQVANSSRRACVAQLRGLPNGHVYESPGFWQGLPREEYYRIMAESKIVACPAGGAFPESLRLGEGLEAGCVPIVEDYRFNGVSYWRHVLGEEPPFPVLLNWSEFPQLLNQTLSGWPANRDRLQVWWAEYKKRMCGWLVEDLNAIGGLS